jgi:hypothetical protein
MSRPTSWTSAVAASNDPTIRPSYITSTPVGEGEDLVEVLGDQEDPAPVLAPLEEQPVDRLDRRRRRGPRSAGPRPSATGSGLDLAAKISRWRLPPDSSRARVSTDGPPIPYSCLISSASVRVRPSSISQPRDTAVP